ncbi:serine hydrolase domain-containing protein [Parerythrobacter aestuarii]|uniref:serine hydrolase domain-containing protein n=1 Tax=Parerythrobacter aestuarii TaxID=3020909 RepID=UPI0024DEB821|nr:serine hydrolase domain-containing protein [Parerythrobacter aestuarii]
MKGRAMDDSDFTRTLEAANLPGAAAMLVDADGVRYTHAFGHADAINGTPMTLDTPCQIASMTKALVSVGAMQLVEQGKLSLDDPVDDVLPDLADPQVLTGFDASGAPELRPAARPITLRHLLTHTAGLGYFFIHPQILRYYAHAGMPVPGSRDSVKMPLMFDPGDSWEYSVGTDWVGLAIESATGERLRDYMSANVFAPLEMANTGFLDAPAEGAATVHRRKPEGGFVAEPMFLGGGEFDSGGGGLTSTAPDYARFLQAMLRGGELGGNRILSEDSVAEMGRNQVGELRAGYMGSAMPELAAPFDNFPDMHTGWGLGFLINPERGPNGRSPGSLAWAGIFNSYYWIDPTEGVGGVFVSQLAPFGDQGALDSFGALERMAYA